MHTLRFNGRVSHEPGCPLNSLSPFILELRILLGQAQTFHVILNTIPPGLFRVSSLSNSSNLRRATHPAEIAPVMPKSSTVQVSMSESLMLEVRDVMCMCVCVCLSVCVSMCVSMCLCVVW